MNILMGDDDSESLVVPQELKPPAWLLTVAGMLLGSVVGATELQLLTSENPPLSFLEGAQPKGLLVDVVKEIQRRVGNADPIRVQPWARAYRTASIFPNVAIFIMARTPAREHLFHWVGPFTTSIASIYGKKGSGLSIAGLDEAKSAERILVVRDYYTHHLLQRENFTNLEPITKPENMVKMIVYGRSPLMFATELTLPYLLDKAGAKSSDVELLYTVTSYQTYIGFSLGTPEDVVDTWQAALISMKRDGSYASIYAKWLPGEAPTTTTPKTNTSPKTRTHITSGLWSCCLVAGFGPLGEASVASEPKTFIHLSPSVGVSSVAESSVLAQY